MAMNPGTDKRALDGLAAVLYQAEQAHKARLEALTPFNPNTETPAQYQSRIITKVDDSSREKCYDTAKAIVQHLIDNLEVLGVKTLLDAGPRLVEAYVAGVGSNGGSLTSVSGGPVSGAVDDAMAATATQNNSGNVI